MFCSEWAVNQHRDTIASHIGHADMMTYFSIAENEPIQKVRYNLLEVCVLKSISWAFFSTIAIENAAALWPSTTKRGRITSSIFYL